MLKCFSRKGLAYLPAAIRRELGEEIARLKEHGIRPPLGTLTQEVLASPKAQAQLRDAYQLRVVQERRYCGQGRYDTFLVPRPAALLCSPKPNDAKQEPAVAEAPSVDQVYLGM